MTQPGSYRDAFESLCPIISNCYLSLWAGFSLIRQKTKIQLSGQEMLWFLEQPKLFKGNATVSFLVSLCEMTLVIVHRGSLHWYVTV